MNLQLNELYLSKVRKTTHRFLIILLHTTVIYALVVNFVYWNYMVEILYNGERVHIFPNPVFHDICCWLEIGQG